MRLLLVDDDPENAARLRHHASCVWPDARVVLHSPLLRGPLLTEFLAQGFDAVLVGGAAEQGQGLAALRELTQRGGFAPTIFLAAPGREAECATAKSLGAVDAISVPDFDHERFVNAVRAAALRQRSAQSEWRRSPVGRAAQVFAGAKLKGYRNVRRIAAGSVSELFLAESLEAGALVVLKVTRDARRADGVDQNFARFLQEYEIVNGIRHPNIVRLYDLGITDDYAYLVMEYFARGDLRGQMNGPMPPARALGLALEIAQALDAIHRAGILHRDLKPGNVMIRDDGSIALIDFGLAKKHALEMEITDKGLIFGTPHYMSPEQGHGRPTDARSDLYSLGIVLFEMLTATKPFDADNAMALIYRHAKQPVPTLPASLAQLQPLLERMLAKQPEDRVESAAALTAALRECIAELPRPGLAA
jgi:eukaryotic-like serine/threonine-protein kinase